MSDTSLDDAPLVLNVEDTLCGIDTLIMNLSTGLSNYLKSNATIHPKDRFMMEKVVTKINYFRNILEKIDNGGYGDRLSGYGFGEYLEEINAIWYYNFVDDPYKIPSILDMDELDYQFDCLIHSYFNPPQVRSFWTRLLGRRSFHPFRF